jgi:hypothetical protein
MGHFSVVFVKTKIFYRPFNFCMGHLHRITKLYESNRPWPLPFPITEMVMLISIFLQNKLKFNRVSSKSMVFKGNTNGFSMEFKLKTNGDSIENKWFLNGF